MRTRDRPRHSWEQDSARRCRRRGLPLHPGINLSPLRVDGNAAGLFFVAATFLVLAIGLRGVALFLVIALIAGISLAGPLRWWHTSRPHGPSLEPLGLKRGSRRLASSHDRERPAA